MEKALEDYLNKHNIKYKEHKHPAVFTVEESNKLGLNFNFMHTKSLFLKDDKSNFYLVCMNANKKLNMKSLRKIIHASKLHFASAEELMHHLHVLPGSVSIFTMIHPENTLLLIDEEVWSSPVTGFHPNENTSTLEITHENLEKFCSTLKSEKRIIKLE